MERSVIHSTIVLERSYDASPARVFAAWSDSAALQRWGSPGEGWESSIDRFEFQVGGIALSRFGPKGGESYVNETRYLDIVRDQRIVSAGGMTSSGRRLFVGLLTVEFSPEGTGCRLLMTEQAAFLDGHDQPENHQAGWSQMLDNLRVECARAPQPEPKISTIGRIV
ncbi:MAG: polyketide cyclase [Mesorhizobium sp.]|nr:MAG: polyketide cyclase [Mesorhizobium sp.]